MHTPTDMHIPTAYPELPVTWPAHLAFRSTADWAPEMRLRNPAGKRVPYNECVDWFSLGCVLYEFLRGMSPFRTERALEWCADTIQDKVTG